MTKRSPLFFAMGLFVAAATYVGANAQQAPSTPGPGPEPQSQGASVPTPSPQHAVINRYCVGCHNSKLKTGGLALDSIDVDHVSQNVNEWEKAVRKLRARAMPPAAPGRQRPDEATYESLVAYLETSLDRAAADKPNPGRTDTFHRLNRTEYQNAIRDLLAVEIDATALLPTDDASHGFDNVNIGGLSPTLLDRYLSAAQKISRLAVGSPLRSPEEYSVLLKPDLSQHHQIADLPLGTRGGTQFSYTFPRDGEYEVHIELSRARTGTGIMGLNQPQQVEVAVDGARVKLFEVAVAPLRSVNGADEPSPSEADNGLKTRVNVKAGPHTILATFITQPSTLSETAREPILSDIGPNNRSGAAIFSVAVSGPYGPSGISDTLSRQRIFTCRPAKASDESGCAKTILSTLARRAYRRPATAAEVQDLLNFYKQGRADGAAFDAGVEMGIRAMLVNPAFLFRVERDPASAPRSGVYRIGDLELASRLSFFLWSSIPDDALLDVAVRGQLKDPAVLRDQVKRMLADRRSDALVKSFASQWLYLSNLTAATPDNNLFPDFDDNLRQAMQRETEMFFSSIKDEDRSVIDLLTANYSFLNERLAKHYGVPGVYGSSFRRVTFPADSPRGGLLGQGSILIVTSYNDRTSPVRRGKWVLENLLGMPPPAPPPNVPPLKDNGIGGKVLSMRDRMIAHRGNPVCASCHAQIDPIGLATENFDAVGQWRDKTEDGAKVDASGGFTDGSTFEGMNGLKKALVSRPDVFVTTLTEKLMTYALGRGLDGYDAAAVRAITRAAKADDYRFSSIILGIAKSVPFQMRTANPIQQTN
jgi:mono/diheme cytochrome c family protein